MPEQRTARRKRVALVGGTGDRGRDEAEINDFLGELYLGGVNPDKIFVHYKPVGASLGVYHCASVQWTETVPEEDRGVLETGTP